MNYRTINKSNTLISLLKIKILNSNKSGLKNRFMHIVEKISSIPDHLFNNTPYLFDDNIIKNDLYNRKELNNYKDNVDLRLIESRRTFL